jgi:hypothetical protein
MSRIDLTGMRFGRFTVLGVSHSTEKNLYWKALCDCGNTRIHQGRLLRHGTVISCGCYHREIMTKHGDNPNYTKGRPATEYKSWDSAKSRCFNKNDPNYFRYGARGISMCENWRNSYTQFLKDMGRKPFTSATLDRIDNDGNYEHLNCRWATKSQQARNRRQRTHYGGKPIKIFG